MKQNKSYLVSLAYGLVMLNSTLLGQLSFAPKCATENWHYRYYANRTSPREERALTITTCDGLNRNAIFTLAENPLNAKGCVLLCHPAAYNKSFMSPYVDMLFKDYHCLRFDFRRHGQNSRKQCTTMGRDEAYDVEAAVNCLREQPECKDLPLYGFGISMGGAALLEAQVRYECFDALILQSTFDSLGTQIKRHSKFFQIFPFLIFRQPTRWYAHSNHRWKLRKVRPYRRIRAVDIPIFLVHAKDDKFISLRSFNRLLKNGKSVVRTWTPDTGKHTEILEHYPETYAQHCAEFFAQISTVRQPQEMVDCPTE